MARDTTIDRIVRGDVHVTNELSDATTMPYKRGRFYAHRDGRLRMKVRRRGVKWSWFPAVTRVERVTARLVIRRVAWH